MNNEVKNRVCPVELAGGLDSKIRRWIQNPQKILSPFLQEGMKVLDVGCGPGYFTIEMAKMVGLSGKVIAADLQEGMLQKVKAKITGTLLEKNISLVQCDKDKINVNEKVDFVLCFYMVHEIPDKDRFFSELKNILNKNGRVLIVEPPFHVSEKDFDSTLNHARHAGLSIGKGPKMLLQRTAVLNN
jgi:ubiquinone/menaquinone biosynthesis C-methylase UbiE